MNQQSVQIVMKSSQISFFSSSRCLNQKSYLHQLNCQFLLLYFIQQCLIKIQLNKILMSSKSKQPQSKKSQQTKVQPILKKEISSEPQKKQQQDYLNQMSNISKLIEENTVQPEIEEMVNNTAFGGEEKQQKKVKFIEQANIYNDEQQEDEPYYQSPKEVDNSRVKESYPGENVLKYSGILEAYEGVLKKLCICGLPKGRIYEFSAQEIEKFEKRKITRQLKMKAEIDIQKIAKRKILEKSQQKQVNSNRAGAKKKLQQIYQQ